MSLINQALKKAQRPRPEASPGAASHAHLRPTHTERQPAFRLLNWFVGGGILIIGIVSAVALTLVLLSPAPEPVVPPVAPGPVKVQLARPAEPAPAELATTSAQPARPEEPVVPRVAQVAPPEPEAQEAEPQPTVPQEAPPAVAQEELPVPEGGELPPAKVAAATPEAPARRATAASSPPEQPVEVANLNVEPPPPPPLEPIPDAEPSPKVLAFLESSRISGVKVAGSQGRLLMNNQVFNIDDIVQPETGLRITEIQANIILFTDESGIQYRKQFRR